MNALFFLRLALAGLGVTVTLAGQQIPHDLSSLPSGSADFSVEAVLLPTEMADKHLPPADQLNVTAFGDDLMKDNHELFAKRLQADSKALLYDKGACRPDSGDSGLLILRAPKKSQAPELALHVITLKSE